MKLSTKVAYNTIIQIVSKIISTLIGLIAIALFTRYLGQFGFGEYTTVTTFISFFAVAADLGLTLVTVQMLSRPNIDNEKTIGNLFTLRLLSAVIIIGLAPLAVFLFPYSNVIKYGVLITAASYIFIALNQVFVGLFQKALRMDKVSISEVVSRIFLVAGAFFVIKYNYGLNGVLIVTVISSAINFAFLYFFANQITRVKLYYDPVFWKEIFKRSWPLTITIVLNLIYLRTDTLFLSLLPRKSELGIIAETGLYGAAYKVIDVIVTLPFIFSGIILPILTSRWHERNKQSFNSILQKSFEILTICAVPLVIGTQMVAGDVINLIAGDKFAAAAPILRILIFAAGFIFIGNIFAHAIIAIDQQKRTVPAYAFTALTSVLGYLFFIEKFSYIGAAYVTVYSEMSIALASIYFVWKYTKFLPSLKILIKTIAASIVMALIIVALHYAGIYNLFVTLTSAIAAYFIALYIFKGMLKNDILILLNK